jgi:hypothetical protein
MALEGGFVEDRSMLVQPGEQVVTMWIPIDQCVLGNRTRMDLGAIDLKYRKLLQLGEAQTWPPIVGEWGDDNRFVVLDGRHEYLAALALGREQLFVAFKQSAELSA